MTKVFNTLLLSIWVYIIIFIPPLLLIHFIYLFLPNSLSLANLTEQTPKLTTLLAAFLLLSGLGTILSLGLRKIKPTLMWRMPYEGIFLTFISSSLVSLLAWRYFSPTTLNGALGIALLFFSGLIYLPLLQNFLQSFNLALLNKIFRSNLVKIMVLIFLFSIHLLVLTVNKEVLAYQNKRTFTHRHPVISKIEPQIVYHSAKVVIYGKEFGWRGDEGKTKFFNKFGPLDIDSWTNEKIIFTVPLHWKPGEIDIWVEKQTSWQGKKIWVKSNIVKLELLDRLIPWNNDTDRYFEHLDTLGKEALRLNGYTHRLEEL